MTVFQPDMVMTFGKYKGIRTVREVALENAQYLLWATEKIEWFVLSPTARKEAEEFAAAQRKARASRYFRRRSSGWCDYNESMEWDHIDADLPTGW